MRHVVFWGLCLTAFLLPLPFGAVESGTALLFAAAVALLFAFSLFERREPEARNSPKEGNSRPSGGPGGKALRIVLAVLLGVFALSSVLQVIPLPAGIGRALSPAAVILHDGAAGAAGATTGGGNAAGAHPLSTAPGLTRFELIKYVAYALFGLLVFRSVRTRRKAGTFVLVLLAAGLFQATYGLAQTLSGAERIFDYKKVWGLGSVTGTFINGNHLAGFLGMLFPLSLGLLLARADFFSLDEGRSLREKILWFGQERLQKSLLYGSVSVVLALGIIFSRSRSGIIILFISLFVMAGALSATGSGGALGAADGARGGGVHSRRGKRLLRTVLIAAAGAAVMIGIGPVVKRFTKEIWAHPWGRPAFYRDTLRMAEDFPLVGAGAGSYRHVFTAYQQDATRGVVSHAHNDYLETLAEHGYPGGGALMLAGLIALGALGARWARRRDPFVRGAGLGAMAGIAALLLHGITDFNLRIPSNAAYFVGLYALAFRLTAMRRGAGSAEEAPGKVYEKAGAGWPGGAGENAIGNARGREFGNATQGARRRLRFLWLIPAAAFIFLAARSFAGYRAFEAYNAEMARARNVEGSFVELERRLGAAVRLTWDPEPAKELGGLYLKMALAQDTFGTAEERDSYCGRALEAFGAALRRNPADAMLYFDCGKVYLLYNFPLMIYKDKGIALFKRAIALAPTDRFINLHVVYFLLTQWETLDGMDKDYARVRLRAMKEVDEGFEAGLRRLWKENYGGTGGLEALIEASG